MARTISSQNNLSLIFNKILNEWLSSEEITEINTINAPPEYMKAGMCASHEYCDPNEAMAEAFEMVFGRELDVLNNDDITIVNEAWKISKVNQFSTKA